MYVPIQFGGQRNDKQLNDKYQDATQSTRMEVGQNLKGFCNKTTNNKKGHDMIWDIANRLT